MYFFLQILFQTIDDISDTKFKLYLEYVDDDGLENSIYYEVHRG